MAQPLGGDQLRAQARVFHDRADREVPFAAGAAIARAWPGAQLVPTEGLGHNRLLYAPEVVAPAVAFLAEGHPERAQPSAHLPAARPHALGASA